MKQSSSKIKLQSKAMSTTNWTVNKVRDEFVNFFCGLSPAEHCVIPSSSVRPNNDPSLLFCNAGK